MTQLNRSTTPEPCMEDVDEPFPFTMAFQPIVDVATGRMYAYEALARGPQGEPAGSILKQVTEGNRHAFDQNCRVKAITIAARLGLAKTGASLAINFMPGAVSNPAACTRLTLDTARDAAFPLDRLIFEITETEEILDRGHLREVVDEYHRLGLRVALDDFGSAYSGLNHLADFPADMIKLDMALTRNLHRRPSALTIVKHMVTLAETLGSTLVAEGVETVEEYEALRGCGIRLMQGYFFAEPALESLPVVAMEFEAPTTAAGAK